MSGPNPEIVRRMIADATEAEQGELAAHLQKLLPPDEQDKPDLANQYMTKLTPTTGLSE